MNKKNKIVLLLGMQLCLVFQWAQAQKISYVKEFENAHHPEIGYWFISPNIISEANIEAHVDSIAKNCKYTLLFLTSREGANFYDFPLMHPFFKRLVTEAHKKGLKVGLQLWGNYKDEHPEGSQRMIVENEIKLDAQGAADTSITAKYIRFEGRLLKSDLFKVWAFKKTGDGFYDPATLIDISKDCKAIIKDKATVQVQIHAPHAKGLTACIMTQQYVSQSSMWDDVEINGFTEAMHTYRDIPFDGFALDEYGNKFVIRSIEMKPTDNFRARWYSNGMAREFQKTTGQSLDKTLFDGRYAPAGKPEVRIKAINVYMDFMRKGALRVENAVYKKSKEIFGDHIFNGIHNTYHNSLVNDEIWANGIGWWKVTRHYAQSDEKTPTATQMGMAMAHADQHVMYNQFYDKDLEPVTTKALQDLRYGIRTHYHALNDKRPLRFDLEFPEAVLKINRVENCARMLNQLNPQLPEIKLLVVFGIEALSNWYPYQEDRGFYDINDKMKVEERAVELWNGGYLNALLPSDLIENGQLTIGADGKPVLNGHRFDAMLYLNPQFARESEIKFLETYQARGGKLMIEGRAMYNFEGKNIAARFQSIYDKATVKGYDPQKIAQLGIVKNALPDGCKSSDGLYVYTDYASLNTDQLSHFTVKINGNEYQGTYKGMAAIGFDAHAGIEKLAIAGLTDLKKNQEPVLSFKEPTDVLLDKTSVNKGLQIADPLKAKKPMVNRLF